MRSELFKSVFAMMVVVGSVGAGVATVVACSGSSTGTGSPEGGTTTGTSGGTGGMKGIFGGGAGGTTSVPTTCTPSSSDDPCTACLKQQCCSQTVACGTSAECSAIITCAGSCDSSSSTCVDSCVSAHPGGQSLVSDLVRCEESSTCKAHVRGHDVDERRNQRYERYERYERRNQRFERHAASASRLPARPVGSDAMSERHGQARRARLSERPAVRHLRGAARDALGHLVLRELI